MQQKWKMSQFPRAQGNVFKCLVLFQQQPKAQIYSVRIRSSDCLHFWLINDWSEDTDNVLHLFLLVFISKYLPFLCWLNPFFKRKRTDCEAQHRDPLKRFILSSNRNMWLTYHVLHNICQNILRGDPLMWQQSVLWKRLQLCLVKGEVWFYSGRLKWLWYKRRSV